jgi:CrcB protein
MRRDLRELVAIFVGGALGALVRVEIGRRYATGSSWPWATFTINIAGTLLLGYFATRLQERLPLSAYRRPFLGTGICGALTTFSTMQFELFTMLQRGNIGLAVGYATASIGVGFLALAAATAAVRRVRTL